MAQQATPNSKYAGKRLLIADDDTEMRLLLAEYFRRLGFRLGQYPNAEAYYRQALTLPLYPGLDDAQQDRVVRELMTLLD